MKSNRKYGPVLIVFLVAICALASWNVLSGAAYRGYVHRFESAPPNYDFSAYYLAGKAFDKGLDPYVYHSDDIKLGPVGQDKEYGYETYTRDDKHSRYMYPPYILPVFGFLSVYSYDAGRLLWLFFYLVTFIAAIVYMLSIVEKNKRKDFILFAIVLSLAWRPLVSHICLGQISLVAAAVGVSSYVAYEKKMKWFSAVLLAVVALIKVSPCILALYFVLYKRDYFHIARLVASAGFLMLASLVVVPASLYASFVLDVLPSIAGGRSYYFNQSLVRLLTGTCHPAWSILLSIAGVSLFVTLALRVDKKRVKAEVGMLVFVLNILTMLLFAPLSWSTAYVWLILPVAMIVSTRSLNIDAGITKILFCLAVMLMAAPIYPRLLFDSLNMAGGVLLYLLLAHTVISENQETTVNKN